MDAEALLQPVSDDSPSGDNLEYDPVFTDMELAAQPGEETQIGDEIKAASDPDYREVREKALQVLGRSHDIRAAVYLAQAVLPLDGLPGFATATAVIRGYLEQYWDSCHPELDEDDDMDPTMRINAVQDLCGQPGGLGGPSPVYRNLRRAPLTDSRGFGRFSLRDMEIAGGQAPVPDGMDSPPDSASVSAAFQDTDKDVLTQMHAAAVQATENVRAISAVFDDKTPGQGPELDPLIKQLVQISKRLGEQTGDVGVAEDGDAADTDAAAPESGGIGGGGASVQSAPGTINSPADVTAALDRIIGYYKRAEPSSPLPILLERAKRLVGADFMTIIHDMAPGGLSNVQSIGGLEE